MANNRLFGHLAASFAAVNWGFTFILSNMLLKAGLSAYEALLLRSLVAYAFLWLISLAARQNGDGPFLSRRLRQNGDGPFLSRWLKGQRLYMVAGMTGLSVYYLLDYTALLYTSASFVTLICATVPLFVTIALWLVHRERPSRFFLIGSLVAVFGVAVVATAGGEALRVTATGTLLVAAGNVLWAIYTLVGRQIDAAGATDSPTLQQSVNNMRKVFFWAIASLLAAMPLFGFDVSWKVLFQVQVFIPILVLGVMTSALTFIAYGLSVRLLGAARAGVYLYFPPVIGALAGHFLLGETLTVWGVAGIAVVVVGLLLSELKRGEASG